MGYITGYKEFSIISANSGPRKETINITFGGGVSFDLTHANGLFVWMKGFAINKQVTSGGTLDLAIYATLTSSTTYDLTFASKGTTLVYYA